MDAHDERATPEQRHKKMRAVEQLWMQTTNRKGDPQLINNGKRMSRDPHAKAAFMTTPKKRVAQAPMLFEFACELHDITAHPGLAPIARIEDHVHRPGLSEAEVGWIF